MPFKIGGVNCYLQENNAGYILRNSKILSIPAHSMDLVGVLLNNSNLSRSDLPENQEAPSLDSIMDDILKAKSSITRSNILS
jgi:hypothetical protein